MAHSSTMIQPGARSLRKIAVVGRGTAGSLAAAGVTRLHPDADHELHHIYDSRIPVIGVGEGSWPSLVQHLQELTDLPHAAVQQRLKGTRKYGVAFDGWGRRNRDFIHYFAPQEVSYAYHLSADYMAELLHESTRARHVDANVVDITRVEGGARVEFEDRPPERYDLVFDARGFPAELHPERAHRAPLRPHQYSRHPPLPGAIHGRAGRTRPATYLYPRRCAPRTAGYSSFRSRCTPRTATSSTAT